MKSSPSPVVLNVEIKPSQLVCAVLGSFALLAVAAIFCAAIPLWLQVSLAVGCALFTLHAWRTQQRQRGRLLWRESAWVWQAVSLESVTERSVQLRSVTLWPVLIVLEFRDVTNRRALTFSLWRDSLDSDSARRLRVCLAHSPVFAT